MREQKTADSQFAARGPRKRSDWADQVTKALDLVRSHQKDTDLSPSSVLPMASAAPANFNATSPVFIGDLRLRGGLEVLVRMYGGIAGHFLIWLQSSGLMVAFLLDAWAKPLARQYDPGHSDHGFMPLDEARVYKRDLLETEAGHRLETLTRESSGYRKGECPVQP